MYNTRAIDAYIKNPTSDNLLYKAILSLEFKREELEDEVIAALEQLKSIALKNQFNSKDWAAKQKSASNYVYDQEMKEFARSIRKSR
jgi:hypothetical protein